MNWNNNIKNINTDKTNKPETQTVTTFNRLQEKKKTTQTQQHQHQGQQKDNMGNQPEEKMN